MTAPLTAAYGEFIGALKYKALPANAVAVIKQGFIDCIGVMLAGSREKVAGAVERVVTADQPHGPSNIFFSNRKTTAAGAALIK